MTAPANPTDDEFFRFLAAEGVIDDATIPSGTDRAERIRELVAKGELSAAALEAARERFRQRDTTASAATAPARDPLLGQVLGGCRVESLLGAGGMGAVYRATQISIDRPVALKVQKGAPLPELVERFRSEARLLGRLHSPHIVDVYDVGTEAGLQYFVMEFMPGGSLTGYVRKLPEQKLPPEEARRMLIECCLGLAEAAEHGVLHRDIKPDNLLLDARATVKIADFGIAKLLDAEYGLTQTGFSPGTPAFKSPEQVAASELDFRTDMYSLGVSFWMLITGARPADSLTRQEALERLPQRPPFSAPEVSLADGDPLMLAICRMMALKRADRFESWQHLIDTLRALPAAGAAVPVTAPAPRRARWWIAAAALVVAVVALVLWSGREPGPVPPPHGGTGNGAAAAAVTPGKTTPTPGAPDNVTTPAAPDGTADARQAATQPPAGPAAAPQDPQPSTPPPVAVDPDAEARRQFFAELGAPLPTSPRTAAEVDAQAARLRARASALHVADDPAWVAVAAALDREHAAAEARDALLRVASLSTFEQHAELAAAAAAIELPAYRQDASRHVQALFDGRPLFLRVADADVTWLRTWADWDLNDANTSSLAGRPLPHVVRDRRRGCRMVLVGADGEAPSYLDAAEVSLGQWRASGRSVQGLQGPDDDSMPVRNVAAAEVDAFLAASGARLPTVAEFGSALGTRAGDRYWWGNAAPPAAGLAINLADQARHRQTPTAPYLPDYDDGVATVAGVEDPRFVQGVAGAFHHLLGNVAEVCLEDGKRVVLGGSYLTSTWDALQTAQRTPVLNPARQDIGFRAARTVGR